MNKSQQQTAKILLQRTFDELGDINDKDQGRVSTIHLQSEIKAYLYGLPEYEKSLDRSKVLITFGEMDNDEFDKFWENANNVQGYVREFEVTTGDGPCYASAPKEFFEWWETGHNVEDDCPMVFFGDQAVQLDEEDEIIDSVEDFYFIDGQLWVTTTKVPEKQLYSEFTGGHGQNLS